MKAVIALEYIEHLLVYVSLFSKVPPGKHKERYHGCEVLQDQVDPDVVDSGDPVYSWNIPESLLCLGTQGQADPLGGRV